MHQVTDSELAARATLIALRATLDSAELARRNIIIFLPSMRPISTAQAVTELMNLAKPVTCIATMAFDELMAIATWHTEDTAEHDIEYDEMLHTAFQDCIRLSEPGVLADVLLRGPDGDEIVLTFNQCQQWLREYTFLLADCNLAPTVEPQDRSYARCLVQFWRSTGGHFDALDTPG